MVDVKIRLSILWVACMLCYLLGDIPRIWAINAHIFLNGFILKVLSFVNFQNILKKSSIQS